MIVPKFVVLLWLFRAFFFPEASCFISIKYVADTVKSEQDVLIYSLT